MEQKFPFTTLGCRALQAKLYELPQAELDAEADVLQLNFTDWVSGHFELTAAETGYLKSLSEQTVGFTAAATSMALRNRLPIVLQKTGKKDDDEIFKILDVKNELTVTEGQGLTVISGQVFINLAYLTSSGRH